MLDGSVWVFYTSLNDLWFYLALIKQNALVALDIRRPNALVSTPGLESFSFLSILYLFPVLIL